MALPVAYDELATAYETRNNSREEDLCNLDDEFYDSEMLLAAEESRAFAHRERQISVDPLSVKESYPGEASFNFMVDPVKASQLCPPLIIPTNPNLLCTNIASSSPRSLFNKKQKHKRQSSPRLGDKRHWGSSLWPSKSCGDGDKFDLPCHDNKPNANANANANADEHDQVVTKGSKSKSKRSVKCTFCLFLPGLGKGKKVRPRKEEALEVLSRSVSMEKFECGSWASSEDGDSKNLYFDLPMELIKTGFNEATSPVSAAFIFDKERNVNTKAAARKSHEPTRHVHFLPPSSCIRPRLLKARQDLTAYLEAQTA